MKHVLISIAAFSSLCLAADAPVAPKRVPAPAPASALSPREVSIGMGAPPAAPLAARKVSFAEMPLSFEPNVGQSASEARFTARTAGYSLDLEPSVALFRFAGPKSGAEPKTLAMEMLNANRKAGIKGEDQLLGKANYFPTSDPKTWFSNIPTYSRVHYSSVYPGVDVAFYGNANRLEYDFALQPGADPAQIQMKLTGSEHARIDSDGNLVLRIGKDDIRFLKPVAYQTSADGSHHDAVLASYRVEQASDGRPALVSFNLGSYDRKRPLVIDPVLALSYAQYLDGIVADVVVDGSGNTYVTGQNISGSGFYVTEFNSSGTVVYDTTIGTSTIYPNRVRVDGTGRAYVAGYLSSGATLPTGPNSYQSTSNGGYDGFLVQIAAGGASVPYATFIGAADTYYVLAQGLGVQTISGTTYAYITGTTESTTFPVTVGAYQSTFSGTPGNNDGFVAKFNPAASGNASLVYSTYLGPAGTNLTALAVDSSGNTYVTGNSTSPAYPVTNGSFQYSGYESASGGVYVTKLNPTGTALVYSAYLGYGWGYGIAVDGQATPNVYVTGTVAYDDFPTTTGAYQTTYPGGFAVKLSTDGSTEVYSTFLGGPSSVAEGYSIVPSGLALANGCVSSCTAYISGYTSTADFPTINALQTTESTSASSAFIVELAQDGSSALFSSYLSGLAGVVYDGAYYGVPYGLTPALGVDASGNISVVGNLGGAADFPVTITNANPAYAFLARISSSASPFTWSTPTSVNFANQPVGISTSVYNYSNTANTVTIRNISATAVTISSIQVSPSSIFTESDTCAGDIPAGGSCVLTINFTPAVAGVRAGTVTVNSNASDSPTVVSLTGTGLDTAFAQASATSLSFGNQNVGSTSAPQTVTLTNTGDLTATFSIYMGSGTDFSVLNTCSSPLAPGATCTATVTFDPTQTGLRTDTLYVTGGPVNVTIPVSGTGLASGANGTLGFSAASYDFGSATVGTTSATQYISVTNTGSVPVSISAMTASGDFALYYYTCGALPFQLNPEASCTVYTTFTPSAAGLRTGNLTFTDSASGSPQSVALSGTGLAGVKTLEFYPSSGVNFGSDQPVGVASGAITVYAQNAGTSPITIDRILVSGDFLVSATNCSAYTLTGTTDDGTGSLSQCYVYVTFNPTATGLRTGTLTFIDNAANNPQTVALSGNAIAATGAIAPTPAELNYATQAVGTTSATQGVLLTNPGDTPITVNSYSTGTGNFSVTDWYCSTVPFVLGPGASCGVYVSFTPTSSGSLTDSLTVNSSAGSATVSLAGTGVAETKTIAFTPTSPLNSGSVVVGQHSGTGGSDGQTGDLVSIRNTGTAAVTFSANPAITGTNMGDFALYNPYSCGNNATQLQPGASCPMWITFTPGAAGARTATLTFTDDATGTTQAIALHGTGISSTPTSYYLSNNLLNYDNQVQGTTSPTNTYLYFYNNSGASVTLGNVVLTSGFLIPGGNQTCNGQTIANASSCYVYVSFAPTSSGLITGTITFKNSSNTTLVSAPLSGYAPAPTLSALLTPGVVNFTTAQVVTSTSSYQTTVLTNTGNLPLTIGAVTGTNLGATPTNEFTIYSDGCGGGTLNPGATCTEYFTFTPNATGARSGSATFPVTYTGGSTANFTANLTGTGVAEANSAVVQPGSANFVDQTVGVQTPYTVLLYLVNRGNLPFKVGTVTGVNTITSGSPSGEFSIEGAQGGSDGCSGLTSIAANTGSCAMYLTFTPSATGARTGSITFPVTFSDNTTTNVTANLSGNGVAAAPKLQFQPYGLQFPPEIQANTSPQAYIAVTNIGNKTVHFSTQAVPSAGFVLGGSGDGCFALSLNNLAPGQTCYIYVSFAPTTTGNITGTLTVHDNATGGPHALTLSGKGISANQQIVLSQTALTFGNQPQGSTSSAQVVYVTNQSDSTVTSVNPVLGGTNQADFTLTNNCPASLGARTVCTLSVTFNPAISATGTRSANIVLSDSDPGSSRTITLTGTAVVAGPAIALSPVSPLTFTATWNVGTTSTTRNISARNTGSANLTISKVALSGTNAGDFAIVSDGCSGATLTPNTDCKVGVQFSPSLGGTRTANVSFTDNAAGSPQVEGLSGTGHGIPMASLSASTVTFAATNIGTTTATQSVTLSNPGTDVLNIANIALAGPAPGDFTALGGTCPTTFPATLAPGASCTLTTAFDPTATGLRTASIIITSNANNVAGSTSTVILNGTGLGIPTANLNLNTLSFGVSNVGTATASQTVILSNPGTNVLNIASIVLTGTNPGDFTTIVTTCGPTLAVGANCTISTSFLPTAAGSRSASILITDNNGGVNGSTQSVALSGTGGIPTASPSPAGPLTYANTLLGAFSAAQTVTLTNTGTGPLTVTGVSIGGANPADFAQTNNCSTVAPSGTCTISVQFGPTVVGARAATLQIVDNSGNVPGTQQNIALTGTGYGVPKAAVAPSPLNFGNSNIGTATAPQSVTLTNAGTDTLVITKITLNGVEKTDFTALGGTCPVTFPANLAAGGSCTISTSFLPTAVGTRTANINVVDNAGNVVGAKQNVNMNGTGVGIATASVTPGPLNFSQTLVGTTNPTAQTVTVSNTGTATLTVTSVALVGTNPTSFAQTNNCGGVAVGGNCTVTVKFAPAAPGALTATLQVTDNSGNVAGTQQNVTLNGTGVTPVAPTATSVAPSSFTGAGPENFVFTYTDSNFAGSADLNTLYFLFTRSGTSAVNACYGYYVKSTNQIFLYNNAGTALVAGSLTPGTAGTLANSQCSLNGATSATSFPAGSTATLTLATTALAGFPGTANIFGQASDNESQTGALGFLGNWNTSVEVAPTLTSVTPIAGSGLGPQQFTFVYSDGNGSSDLNTLYANINGSVSTASACSLTYAVATNELTLSNQAGTGNVGIIIPGQAGTLTNNQCSVDGASAVVTPSGNTYTMSVTITFAGTFTGSKNVYMKATDNEGQSAGYTKETTYTP